jgi:hypothetical protein
MSTQHKPTAYIKALILTFPCLQGFAPAPGERFDPDEWMHAFEMASSGERQCAAFILAVWNPMVFGDQFNLIEFAGSVDAGNRAALMAWLERPFFP